MQPKLLPIFSSPHPPNSAIDTLNIELRFFTNILNVDLEVVSLLDSSLDQNLKQ